MCLQSVLVAGQVAAEREQRGEEGAEPEHGGETRALARQQHDSGERRERHEPAEEDEGFEVADVPRDEVAELRRVALDLGERPAGRAAERRRPDEHARRDRGERARHRGTPAAARPHVRDEERDGAEREVHLPRQRD